MFETLSTPFKNDIFSLNNSSVKVRVGLGPVRVGLGPVRVRLGSGLGPGRVRSG